MIKDKVTTYLIDCVQTLYGYLYSRPKRIVQILVNPSRVIGQSYFPEKKAAPRWRIMLDQIINIIRYGNYEEYYYMYGLDVKPHSEQKKYVIYPQFMKRRDYLNLSSKHNSSCILRNKLYFAMIANGLNIRTPHNVAYTDCGSIIILDSNQSIPIRNFIQSFSPLSAVFKPLEGECGSGVRIIDIEENTIKIDKQPSSTIQLSEILSSSRGIIQERLNQHHEMNRLYPHSVNTIRMITVRNPHTGVIEVLPPTLRIGAHGNLVDNFSCGGVIVAMNAATGKLSPTGYFKPQYGYKASHHPDTGIEFGTFTVPFYQEAKEVAIRFHSFLDLHSIGWDIAIDESGPVIIEGNDNWEINLPQNADNPFYHEFKRLFY